MKVSDLIDRLQEIHKEAGDLEVACLLAAGDEFCVDFDINVDPVQLPEGSGFSKTPICAIGPAEMQVEGPPPLSLVKN